MYSDTVIYLVVADHPGLLTRRQVEKFQEKAFQELRSYVSQTFPEDRDRFPRLLLRLPPLRALQPQVMEELFFAGLIGNVQIDSVIPYILRMGAGEYSSQRGGYNLVLHVAVIFEAKGWRKFYVFQDVMLLLEQVVMLFQMMLVSWKWKLFVLTKSCSKRLEPSSLLL